MFKALMVMVSFVVVRTLALAYAVVILLLGMSVAYLLFGDKGNYLLMAVTTGGAAGLIHAGFWIIVDKFNNK